MACENCGGKFYKSWEKAESTIIILENSNQNIPQSHLKPSFRVFNQWCDGRMEEFGTDTKIDLDIFNSTFWEIEGIGKMWLQNIQF